MLNDKTFVPPPQQGAPHASRIEAIGRLAGGVAHDFNNLLMVIDGYSEIALHKCHEAAVQKCIIEIRKATKRACKLTSQLLAFSRKQVLQTKVVDLNMILHNLNKMLCRIIGEDIELVQLLNPIPCWIKVDPVQIEQVIMNLAINARDAMAHGGTLTFKSSIAEQLATDKADNTKLDKHTYVLMEVTDTGCGMDDYTQAYIFEPFFTTKERNRGTGLGLSTVYGIIKQSGGEITVSSKLGKGTRFRVYLPVTKDKAKTEDTTTHTSLSRYRGKETVLVVDDEPAVRKLVCQLLEMNGYIALSAENGEQALRLYKQHDKPIHLIVTDMIMPLMGGRKFIQALMAYGGEPKVLFMSGYLDQSEALDDIASLTMDFLQKPIRPKVLVRKVRELLDRG